jgi:hypothetical protein
MNMNFTTVPGKADELVVFADVLIQGLADHVSDFPDHKADKIVYVKELYQARAAQLATLAIIKEDTANALDELKSVVKFEIAKATATEEKLNAARMYLDWTGPRYKYGPPMKPEGLLFVRRGLFCRINWQASLISATNAAAKQYVMEINGVIKYAGSASECEVEAASGDSFALTAYNEAGASESFIAIITV